jgi:hypothetical protein
MQNIPISYEQNQKRLRESLRRLKMRNFKFLALVLILMLSLASLAYAQDEEVPSFDFPVLVDVETVEGEFTESSMQIYSFIGSEGDEVTAEMLATEDSLVDPYLIILGPNGEVVGYNDDSDGFDSMIEEAELPVDGLYLVVATTWSELRNQTASEDSPLEDNEYELTVEGFNEPEEITDETTQLFGYSAAPAEGEESINLSGDMTIEEGLPVAYVFFWASEGQEISIVTDEASTDEALSDPIAYLFSASGERIAGVDDSNGFFPEIEVEAPEDGLYLAFITTYGFQEAAEMGDDFAGFGDVFVELTVE